MAPLPPTPDPATIMGLVLELPFISNVEPLATMTLPPAEPSADELPIFNVLPLVTTTLPEKLLPPLSTSVPPAPAWITEPVPETLFPSVTVSERAKARLPLLTIEPGGRLPAASLLPTCNVPPLMVTPPLKLLAPLLSSTSVPEPALAKLLGPPREPLPLNV